MSRVQILSLLGRLAILPTSIVLGGERHVPAQYLTIQSAINATSAGDEVVIAPGLYRGNGNRDIDFKGKRIVVRSVDPEDWTVVAATVIDSQGSPSDQHRGFLFVSGEDAGSQLAGLTITGGYGEGFRYGGGIECEHSGPTIRNCIIRDNTASYGGGIHSGSDALRMLNCVIVGNRAINGGGLSCAYAAPLIAGCRISENEATGFGGGLHCDTSNPRIINCTIANNSADIGGGAYFREYLPIIANSILWGNRATDGANVALRYTGTVLDVYSSVVEGGESQVSMEPGTSIIWHVPNLTEDPQFTDPVGTDGLADTWEDNDYRLSDTSPCVDTADLSWLPPDLIHDLSGGPRIINGQLDMGAFENPAAYPAELLRAVSRRQHGLAGVFDIPLSLSGSPAVECRTGGPTQIILTFNKHMRAADGWPDESEVELSSGFVGFVEMVGPILTINLIGVEDGTCLEVGLDGIEDLNGNPLAGLTDLWIRALRGDVNSDGVVASGDITQVKSVSGQLANSMNFRRDVNCDGVIASADVTQVKARSGRSVSCP